jgi:hypothetical protein
MPLERMKTRPEWNPRMLLEPEDPHRCAWERNVRRGLRPSTPELRMIHEATEFAEREQRRPHEQAFHACKF